MRATLRSLAAGADAATRTYEARYTLASDDVLTLGATVTVRLASTDASRVMVPLAALNDAGKGPGVWLVSENPPHVNFRSVRVSALGEESAEVGDGLQGGERIIALGAHLLKEGQHVRLESEPDR